MKSGGACALTMSLLLAAALLTTSCRYRVHGRDRMTEADVKEEARSEVSYQQPEETGGQAAAVSADGLEIPEMKSSKGQLLRRTGYTTQYNSGTRCPDWTAWHLTAAHTNGSVKRKSVDYQEDLHPMTEATCDRQATTSGVRRPCKTVSSTPTCVRRTTT